jgi:magnesium-transporting ATPase (P-type)
VLENYNCGILILTEITAEIEWDEKNYPDLFMPMSPCITLQWCYRDGKLVNLPWALLVDGDVIVLQPAQKVVADCRMIEVN